MRASRRKRLSLRTCLDDRLRLICHFTAPAWHVGERGESNLRMTLTHSLKRSKATRSTRCQVGGRREEDEAVRAGGTQAGARPKSGPRALSYWFVLCD